MAGTRHVGQVNLKPPRPQHEGYADFGKRWRAVMPPQPHQLHPRKHDGNPKRDADEIVEPCVEKNKIAVWLDDKPVQKIQPHTRKKKRVEQVTECALPLLFSGGVFHVNAPKQWSEPP